LILALAAFIAAGTSGLAAWDGITPGPGFFPRLLAAAGVLLAVLQLLAVWRGVDAGEHALPSAEAVRRVVMVVAGMIGLIVLAPLLGMVPAVALLMAFLLLVVLRQKVAPSLAAVVIVALAIEVVFVRWLGVPLPQPPFLS
jgi:hypothetical protein